MRENELCASKFLPALLLLLILLTGCATTSKTVMSAQQPTAEPTWPKAGMSIPESNRVTFQVTGARTETSTWQSHILTSKLRHRLKEFTIFIQEEDKSLIIAFYGYAGPGSYTLSGPTNGGDIRLDFGPQTGAWDLKLQAGITCDLRITRDEPSAQPGVNHMQGTFNCPQLHAIGSNKAGTLVLSQASFDIYILLES
ncbi:hypothetical protein [Ktedonospora formicarum]|uniref:Uncharacterized protein n=1 Tax=Ktedonospora formicarum TaxID=2778364 RepID=A0A8J3MRG0_9CHLR|nr:hypothetical protein [Ktedonospora formicarum]GHO45010.1 hypothetical protein KSX_31730 [Ktedonospora formicarum]